MFKCKVQPWVPVSPIVSNLFMEDFEEKPSLPSQSPHASGLDMWMIPKLIKASLITNFTHHLHPIHLSINVTLEIEKNGSIPMLDVNIYRKEDAILKFTAPQKETHTDHYFQFDSHQPLERNLGVKHTLRHRAKTLVTEDEDREEELAHLEKVLSISGTGHTDSYMGVTSKICAPPP